ncbi:MAG: hypothetical protein JNM57_11295 [Cyclobacteriaceae bacterium]|nr:hypothetical protein [Cyclobacteriaceae bacterium]
MKFSFWLSIALICTVGCSQKDNSPNYYSLVSMDSSSLWWNKAIFYEIWPRSFQDADGDGSGDFRGMISRLDYLKDLGINGIWLTPIFEAPSYHGYDFKDFYKVESDYGTMSDFENFIQASHNRGIKVILDLVLNHISDQHDWFIKSSGREAGFEDYFIWQDEIPAGWGKPWSSAVEPESVWHWNNTRRAYYYGAFGSSQPDLNLTQSVVVDELHKLASFWLSKGVDGFRLDAVRYAIEEGPYPLQADTKSTIDFWGNFAQYVKSIKPDALLVGEAWTGLDIVGRYRDGGNGLDAAFDFDFGYVMIDILNKQASKSADFGTLSSGSLTQNRENLWMNLQNRIAAAPLQYFSPFLTNHDQNRIMFTLEDDESKAKIAASLLLTTPGTVYIYYGEEIGMTQFKTGDDQYRRAIMQWSEDNYSGFNSTGNFWLDQGQWFPWNTNHSGWWGDYWKSIQGKGKSVESQIDNENSLLHHYKRLIRVRNENPALLSPTEIRYYPVDNEDVWVVENIGEKETIWVIINLSSSKESSFTAPKQLLGKHADMLTKTERIVQKNLTLSPMESLIFK